MSSDGTIFILTYRDYSAYLFAIDPDGKELWNKSISFSDSWYGTVSYATLRVSIDLDGSLYLTIGNSLHALDVNGQERWVYPEISGAASVGIGEDHLFVVDDSGVYLHILTKEGEWIASYFCGNGRYIFGTPCVLPGDNVILTLWLGGVEIVNSTGVRVWDYQLADGASYKAVVDEQGTIYFIVNKDESSPSLMAIGERDLEADILAWEIIWVLSIIFSSVMLLMFIHSFRSIRDADEKGRGSKKPRENRKVGIIVRSIGCLLMLLGLLSGRWALYGSDLENLGLVEVFGQTGLSLTVVLAGAYILIIISCAFHAKWGIAQFVVLALITAVMLLSDPLQTVQGDSNDGWVPQIGFVLAWLGTGIVLLSGTVPRPGDGGVEGKHIVRADHSGTNL